MANIKSFPNNQDVYIGAEDVMRWLHGRTSGVFPGGNNAAVTVPDTPGMVVEVGDGTGWLANEGKNGIVWWIDNEAKTGKKLQLTIDQADSVLKRFDRVIVEWKTTNYVDYPEVKILKGTASSSPTVPQLTNNDTIRQISLARIYVASGVTAIYAANILDERFNASVCGLVTESVKADTSVINQQYRSFIRGIENEADNVLQSINQELSDLEAGTGVELKKLVFSDIEVKTSAFYVYLGDNPEPVSPYQDYPYRAAVALENVLSSMIPNVVYSVAALTDNNFAPVAECYNGGVYIYADSKPTNPVAIDTIICWKG